jgi:hypothetical protein
MARPGRHAPGGLAEVHGGDHLGPHQRACALNEASACRKTQFALEPYVKAARSSESAHLVTMPSTCTSVPRKLDSSWRGVTRWKPMLRRGRARWRVGVNQTRVRCATLPLRRNAHDSCACASRPGTLQSTLARKARALSHAPADDANLHLLAFEEVLGVRVAHHVLQRLLEGAHVLRGRADEPAGVPAARQRAFPRERAGQALAGRRRRTCASAPRRTRAGRWRPPADASACAPSSRGCGPRSCPRRAVSRAGRRMSVAARRDGQARRTHVVIEELGEPTLVRQPLLRRLVHRGDAPRDAEARTRVQMMGTTRWAQWAVTWPRPIPSSTT